MNLIVIPFASMKSSLRRAVPTETKQKTYRDHCLQPSGSVKLLSVQQENKLHFQDKKKKLTTHQALIH